MSDVVPPVSSPSADDPYRTSPPPPAFDRLIVPHAGQQRMALSIGHGLARARIRVDPAATALISIDPGGGLAPHVQVTPDRVRLAWPPSFGDWMRLLFTGARSELAIVLHPDVEWTLAIRGGAADVRADLSAGRCAGVEIAGGCTEVELVLPRPSRPHRRTDLRRRSRCPPRPPRGQRRRARDRRRCGVAPARRPGARRHRWPDAPPHRHRDRRSALRALDRGRRGGRRGHPGVRAVAVPETRGSGAVEAGSHHSAAGDDR